MVGTSKTKVIAVSNQKGGAGKTTTSINTAGALSKLGLHVLVIDLDPQGHSTEGLGLADLYEDGDTLSLYDVLTDLTEKDRAEELPVSHEEFDVIPSHVNMFMAEADLNTARRREERLSLILAELDGKYDMVIIDCPPNLGTLTDNALLASDGVVIPAPARKTSKRALEILFDQIDALEATYEETSIDTLALVANEVRYDGEADEMMEWFGDVFPPEQIFTVRTRVALQRAWDAGVSIHAHGEECDMEDEYLALAEAIATQYELLGTMYQPLSEVDL